MLRVGAAAAAILGEFGQGFCLFSIRFCEFLSICGKKRASRRDRQEALGFLRPKKSGSAVGVRRRQTGALADHCAAPLAVVREIALLLFIFHLIFTHKLFPRVARLVASLTVARAGTLTWQHGVHSHPNEMVRLRRGSLPQHRSTGQKRSSAFIILRLSALLYHVFVNFF